jgi:hypothetical protein
MNTIAKRKPDPKRCTSCGGMLPQSEPPPRALSETIARYREHNDRLEATLRAQAIADSTR